MGAHGGPSRRHMAAVHRHVAVNVRCAPDGVDQGDGADVTDEVARDVKAGQRGKRTAPDRRRDRNKPRVSDLALSQPERAKAARASLAQRSCERRRAAVEQAVTRETQIVQSGSAGGAGCSERGDARGAAELVALEAEGS